MIQFKRALAALVLLVASCQLDLGGLVSAKSSARILDESEPIDIEAIARVMCEPRARGDLQISRLSTVDKLVEFFDQQVSGESHELFKCKQQHGEALRLLQEALNASKANVCSVQKLAPLEDFHNQFVSSLVGHKKSRKEEQREEAPQLLRLLFMHYAMEVDAVCQRNLVKNVELSLTQKFGDDVNERLFDLERLSDDSKNRAELQRAMQKFTELNPVEKCEDALMVWDLIENFRGQKLVKEELDAQTGEPIKLLAKIKSGGALNALRNHCHYKLKPIYSKLILPLIKLADLGYSNIGGQSQVDLEQIRTSEAVKRWISVTQMCEAILPIKCYEDPSLGSKDVVVISQQEAAKLDEAAEPAASGSELEVQLVYEPDTNSLEGLDRLESVATVDSRRLAANVKSNEKARARVIGRTVIGLVRTLRGSLKQILAGRIFFPKSAAMRTDARDEALLGEEDKVDVTQEFSSSLESMTDADIERLEDDAPARMLKSRDKSGGLMGKLRRHSSTENLTDLVAQKPAGKRPTPMAMKVVFGIVAFLMALICLLTGGLYPAHS